MDIVPEIVDALQEVLNEKADILGRESGFIKRQRKLSGGGFAQTLVFTWLSNPDATVEELSQTAATLGISISAQGIDQRFTPSGADFMHQVLKEAVSMVIAQEPVAIPILQRFHGVYIQDNSTVTLPDSLAALWVGCGGSSTKNTSSSVKTHLRMDLNTGKLTGPYLDSGKEHARSSQLAEEAFPKGSLRIADLEYFKLKSLKELSRQGVYWLTRGKSQCHVYDLKGKLWDILVLLKTHCHDVLDMDVLLGVRERVPCRLLAFRVPDEVAKVRRSKLISEAKREGRKPSKKSLALASWDYAYCSVPRELLSLDEAFVLLRARWQIELIFKLWKSHGHIDEWRSEKPWRIMCEVYAKLLAMIIQHWILLACSWEYANRSLFKAAKTIQKHAMHLASAFASGVRKRLCEALEVIRFCLSVGCRINKSRNDPRTYQLLLTLGRSP
ncbi:MAG: IS4 family transposase [Candidatus Thorarchaeota archaeon]|jgi:hypothetical protein